MSIVHNSTYREIIQNMIDSNSSKKGYKSRLAKAAGCQSSYLSRVISGSVHLTLDQASAMADFWEFNDTDSEIFLTMLNRERAGTKSLKDRLDRRLEQLQSNTSGLANARLSDVKLSLDHAVRYYSAWYWSVIHVALALPNLRTSAAIAKRLSLPKSLVEDVLAGLEEMKLVHKVGKGWENTINNLSFTQHRELLSFHHASYRQLANFALNSKDLTGTHYSSVMAITMAEFNELQAAIKTMLSSGKRTGIPKNGELFGFCIDLFVI